MAHLWFDAPSAAPSGMQRFAFVEIDGATKRVVVGWPVPIGDSPAGILGQGRDIVPAKARDILAAMGWGGVTEAPGQIA